MKNLMGGISRVDFQVSLLTAAIVVLSLLGVYYFNYTQTYKDMMRTLDERSTNIYQFLEGRMDRSTFYSINSVADQRDERYHNMKSMLENVKQCTGVMYLYTAKRRDDGAFVYVIDGLPSESADFRNAGDLIEPEIWSDMDRALQGEIILPTEIKSTDWGYIFVSYFPIRDDEKVVGVLGIEFEAGHQYATFRMLRIGTPLIAILTCFIASFIAVRLFKRISNPTLKHLATTDYLTAIKNRNAFEIDLHNLSNRRPMPKLAILSVDLNDLKHVNDTLGHLQGDLYIRSAADLLQESLKSNQVLYRTGGDEYVILIVSYTNTAAEETAALRESILNAAALADSAKKYPFRFSLSVGCAVYDERLDENFYATLRRADQEMYAHKKSIKEGNV